MVLVKINDLKKELNWLGHNRAIFINKIIAQGEKAITKKIFLLALLSFLFCRLNATTCRWDHLQAVIRPDLWDHVTTFTYTLSFADRPTLNVEWGDNTTSVAPRTGKLLLPNYYQRNIYTITHTYPGPGVYKILVQDPTGTLGLKTFLISVNVIFSISTILTVNPAMGRDNTPVLLNPPYDKAAFHHLLFHNPSAFDPDGDSLSYNPPFASGKMEDQVIGILCTGNSIDKSRFHQRRSHLGYPADTGKFNVAMDIMNGETEKIGVVERDMQMRFTTLTTSLLWTALLKITVCNQETLLISCLQQRILIMIILHSTLPQESLASIHVKASFTKVRFLAGSASARFRWIPCHETVESNLIMWFLKSDDSNAWCQAVGIAII